MKSLIVLALTFGFSFALTSSALRGQEPAAPHPLTVEDLWAMQRIGSPEVSPDGRWVAFTATTFSREENKGNGDLWLAPADGSAAPRRLTWNSGSDSDPAWSPDGSSLAFVSKRGEEPGQLYLLPMSGGGEAEPLTSLPIAAASPRWFADGRRIAFVANTFPDLDGDFAKVKERLEERKEDKTDAKVSERRLLRYWDEYRTDGTVPHIFELDLATREVKDLMPGYDGLLQFRSFEWDLAPDGTEIAFAANDTQPPWQELNFDIFLLSLTGGGIRKLTADNPAGDGAPTYTADGRYLLFGRNRRPEIAPDFTRLTRYDRKTGEIVELTADWDHQPEGWTVTPDGATILFTAEGGGFSHLYALPIDGGTPRQLVAGGSLGEPAVAGERVVFQSESFHRPAELMTANLDGSDVKPLTALNAERLKTIDFGTAESVTYEGADGDPVQMHVVFPPGFDRSKKWPLLLLIHGGPHGAWLDSFHYRWNAALFAAPGYVVAAVNFHGSTGFGQAFAESILGNHADKPFTDLMRATDYLIAQGYVDENRLAAAGGSYGGYMVSWILGHTDRFKALINHAGVYDLMAQYASDYTWGRSNNYGAEPWDDPARIDLYSPSRYARDFNTPTLVLHGELDYRVPVTQGINLYGVLTAKGVPARIVIFPKENHWVLKPQAAELWWKEVFAWLEKYVGKGATG